MLDRLPPFVRHLLIVFVGVFLTKVGGAVIAAEGVTGVDWPAALVAGLNAGAVAGVTTALVLYVTPLTRQYGVGKDRSKGPLTDLPRSRWTDDLNDVL